MQQVDRELILTLRPQLSRVPLSIYNANLYTYPSLKVALQPYLISLIGGLKAQVVVQSDDTILYNYSPLLMQEQP
jgi:hypothetical protein